MYEENEEVEVSIDELAVIEHAVSKELEEELRQEREEELAITDVKKPAKKSKKISTKCKCEVCKDYKEPDVYERAIISLERYNPYPWHPAATLQRLFTRNYEFVKDQASVPGLDANLIYKAINRASLNLCWYNGPDDDDEAFRIWIGPIVAEEADRQVLYLKLQEHKLGVYWAISNVTKYCADLGADLGDPYRGRWSETVREIAADVWVRLYADPWQFETLGYVKNAAKHPDRKPASLFTRLCRFAYWAARRWKTDQIRERNNQLSGDTDTVYTSDFEVEEERRSHILPGKSQPNLRPNVLGSSAWNDSQYRPADQPHDLPFDEVAMSGEKVANNRAFAA